MTTDKTDKLREVFEHHCQNPDIGSQKLSIERLSKPFDNTGYQHISTQIAWEAWQAATRAALTHERGHGERLVNYKFDTSEYIILNDGISRAIARDISEAPKDGNDILLYGVDENGIARYEVGSWQQMEPDMWMWTCEYREDGITPSQWFHLPSVKRMPKAAHEARKGE